MQSNSSSSSDGITITYLNTDNNLLQTQQQQLQSPPRQPLSTTTAATAVATRPVKKFIEGYLTKSKRGLKSTTRRWFVLNSESLSYYTSSGAPGEPTKTWLAWVDVKNISDVKKLEPGLQFMCKILNCYKKKPKQNHLMSLFSERPEWDDMWFRALTVSVAEAHNRPIAALLPQDEARMQNLRKEKEEAHQRATESENVARQMQADLVEKSQVASSLVSRIHDFDRAVKERDAALQDRDRLIKEHQEELLKLQGQFLLREREMGALLEQKDREIAALKNGSSRAQSKEVEALQYEIKQLQGQLELSTMKKLASVPSSAATSRRGSVSSQSFQMFEIMSREELLMHTMKLHEDLKRTQLELAEVAEVAVMKIKQSEAEMAKSRQQIEKYQQEIDKLQQMQLQQQQLQQLQQYQSYPTTTASSPHPPASLSSADSSPNNNNNNNSHSFDSSHDCSANVDLSSLSLELRKKGIAFSMIYDVGEV